MPLILIVEPTLVWNRLLGPCLILSIVPEFGFLALIPWRIWAPSSIRTHTTRHDPIGQQDVCYQISPVLGDPGTHLWEALPTPAFPDSGPKRNGRKTNRKKTSWPLHYVTCCVPWQWQPGKGRVYSSYRQGCALSSGKDAHLGGRIMISYSTGRIQTL